MSKPSEYNDGYHQLVYNFESLLDNVINAKTLVVGSAQRQNMNRDEPNKIVTPSKRHDLLAEWES